MKKSTFILALTTCFIFLVGLFLFLSKFNFSSLSFEESLPTYFKYSENDILKLQKLKIPAYKITKKELHYWDEILFDLVRKNELNDMDAANVYAYFFTAQRDAAFLAYNLTQDFYGSLDSISKGVLCIFFPTSCDNLAEKQTNPFSKAIAETVLAQVKSRLHDEMAQSKAYEEPEELEYKGGRPYIGQSAGSKIPWFIKTTDRFRVSLPPSKNDPKWDEQLKLVQNARNNVTDEQKKAVIYWAGGPGTTTAPGIWLDIINDYMWDNNMALEKILLVQSTLAMTLADAGMAVYDSKYTYWAIRPYIRDPALKTIMPTPFHPSYPAGHATFSMAAATLLSHFFPEKKDKWFFLADQASQSRVWGGIHYPIDIEQGKILGSNVANAAIRSLKQSTNDNP